ncbi:MAG: T9SS type A sorting domain-containing protein [Syntrophomonadaceae bacterium]
MNISCCLKILFCLFLLCGTAPCQQNYPNPFNPSTAIKYSISAESKVKLSVYNALGEEIKVLVNEILKSGAYEVTFMQDEVPSGVYFYRITAGSYIQTKIMILLH